MNKKKYMAPVLEMEEMEELEMICGSITSVGGDAGISISEEIESAVTEGEVRIFDVTYFDE